MNLLIVWNHNGVSCNAMEGLFVALGCLLLLGLHGVQGNRISSKEATLDTYQQRELLNKEPIKTIKEDYGELYDCVDFYKQPAFDHPSLKNYTFDIETKSRVTEQNKNGVISDPRKSFYIGLKDGGCPTGTVPIKRITKEDRIQQKLIAERLDVGVTHYAVVQTQPPIEFIGAQGYLSIYAPHTEDKQYSASRIKIQSLNTTEFISFGWRVDPTLYGDKTSHLFIETNTYAGHCFDLNCGFVLVATNLAPGLPFGNISIPGKAAFDVFLFASRAIDGNWWLGIGTGGKPTYVGYWPHILFKDLADFGTFVDWGGEVYSPSGIPGPAMGTGALPHDTVYSSYIKDILVLDKDKTPINPETATYADDAAQYDVKEVKEGGSYWSHVVLFGGSAGGTVR